MKVHLSLLCLALQSKFTRSIPCVTGLILAESTTPGVGKGLEIHCQRAMSHGASLSQPWIKMCPITFFYLLPIYMTLVIQEKGGRCVVECGLISHFLHTPMLRAKQTAPKSSDPHVTTIRLNQNRLDHKHNECAHSSPSGRNQPTLH